MPHLPDSCATEDDVHLDDAAVRALLERDVIVTEKLDGLRVRLSCGAGGRVEATLKPAFRGALGGAVERALAIWVAQHERVLMPLLSPGGAVVGEWVWHRLHVPYDALPDELIAFSLQDRRGRWVANDHALERLASAGLTAARPIWRGRPRSLRALRTLQQRSQFGRARMEGIVVAPCGAGPEACAKWVASGYQAPRAHTMTGAHNALRVPGR